MQCLEPNVDAFGIIVLSAHSNVRKRACDTWKWLKTVTRRCVLHLPRPRGRHRTSCLKKYPHQLLRKLPRDNVQKLLTQPTHNAEETRNPAVSTAHSPFNANTNARQSLRMFSHVSGQRAFFPNRWHCRHWRCFPISLSRIQFWTAPIGPRLHKMSNIPESSSFKCPFRGACVEIQRQSQRSAPEACKATSKPDLLTFLCLLGTALPLRCSSLGLLPDLVTMTFIRRDSTTSILPL